MTVQLIEFPDSQKCMNCVHGRLVMDEDSSSSYICVMDCYPNDQDCKEWCDVEEDEEE
jgi:hypothetical protein